jgi:catechol 2,3-dioxygenase-like lactoylglutathione lyase family enzyme
MAEAKAEKPKANIRFLFNVCNDIDEVRHFYTDLLGMEEDGYMNDENFGYLSYECEGGVYFMFFRAVEKLPVLDEWASQPGWPGRTLEVNSWAIQIPYEDFAEVYEKLKGEGVTLFKPEPEWRQDSYWGLSVRDPMGNTVEVYATPKEKPASTTWNAAG